MTTTAVSYAAVQSPSTRREWIEIGMAPALSSIWRVSLHTEGVD